MILSRFVALSVSLIQKVSLFQDSCGSAGGRLPGQGQGSAGANYVTTPNAKLADPGSKLPPLTTEKPTWYAGSDVEVAWTVKAFHGGGVRSDSSPRFLAAPLCVTRV